MTTYRHETGGLAKGVGGRARVTAFGTSLVAPAVSVIRVLIVMTSYAGFASPLVVLITFAGVAVLRDEHRRVRPPTAGRRLGLHLQQPRVGPGRRLPDRLDDGLRPNHVRVRRGSADQRLRVHPDCRGRGCDYRPLGAVRGHPGRGG